MKSPNIRVHCYYNARSGNGVRKVPFSTPERHRRRPTKLGKLIAALFKEFRERESLSLEDLARKAGMDVERLKTLEAAKDSPYLSELRALANVFGLKASEFMRRVEENGDK